MRKIFSFIFLLFSYLLVVFKIVIAVGIFNNDLTFISKFFMSPLSSIFGLLLAITSGHPIKAVTYLTIALLILLLVSWIVVIISLFLGLKSKKARKKLFAFSIVIAIYDLIILSGLTWSEYINNNKIVYLDRDILWGLILAICVIVVNIACLVLTSKSTGKKLKAK